jgi:adenine-specific DNA-methyltransferase
MASPRPYSLDVPAPPLPELSGFVRDRARSYGDPGSENALVHGENLDALVRLRARFEGAFACVYFDPPFNTGRTFAEYDDALEPSAWREMMHARLTAARPLVADHGAIFVEIDDTQLGHLQLAMDDVFGRYNRVSTITVVRSASTGHKAKNRGPVNVTDFILTYAKDRARWRPRPMLRERRGYDWAYATFLVDPSAPMDRWRFVPLTKHARATLGPKVAREAIERFAIDHARHVVRFAQPRYEAVSREAQRWIDRSHAEPQSVFRLVRPGFKDMVLRGGNRILFLADKVAARGERRVLVEPLTNVWDDIGFQGIAREGGVVFTRNKKPERLIERVIALATEPGEWVLDAFLGSGTTAAVAHKMGRRWVGIERGDHVDALCVPRLRRVVDGDDPTGVTKAYGWKGGGGFGVYEKDE